MTTLREATLESPPEGEVIDVDVLIVGAGIFGSVIGEALQVAGRTVNYIDAFRPDAGSTPAACLMKSSWLSGMGKDAYQPALSKLDDLFGIVDTEFTIRPTGLKAKVHWIPPHRIFRWEKVIKGVVRSISYADGLESTEVIVEAAIEEKARRIRPQLLVLATGYWTKKLYPGVEITGQGGAAFAWEGAKTFENSIRVWAPYKQIVTLNGWQRDTLWVGDGSAILPKNWTPERQYQSLQRCAQFANQSPDRARVLYGIRPYVKDAKPCFLKEIWRNVWVATGGAKNGTAAAGWCAWKIAEATS